VSKPTPQSQGAEAESDPAPLLQRAAGGDEDAWRRLIDAYARRVYAMARSRLRRDDLAEEITQDVFATVASKLSQGAYTERGRFESWLFRVTMNRVRDEARRASRHARPTDPALLLDGGLTEPAPANAEEPPELPALRDALNELTDADRLVVELRHHAEMSFKQIAAYLDEPLGTVLARHHRALRKLKDLINDRTLPSTAEGAP